VPAAASSSPLSVLAAATDLPERPEGLSEIEAITLIAALRSVPDPRKARGRRYSLQALLMLALTGVMAGARSWTALAQWAREGQHKVRLCGPSPSLWTFRRVLCTVDIAAVEAALAAWVLGRRTAAARAESAGAAGPRAAERVVLSCDGKVVRGSRTAEGTATALFGVFEQQHRLVLTQKAITDGNEIAAFAATLDTLPDLRDVLITADALHTQREHATYLHGRDAYYLFTVKGNQPTLRRARARLPWAGAPGQRERIIGKRERFLADLKTRRARCNEFLAPYAGVKLVAYHNSCPYFARRFRLDVVDNGFARRDLAGTQCRTTLFFFAFLAEESEFVIERAHYASPFSDFFLRVEAGTWPRSTKPISAKRRRTGSEGCAPLESHSLTFASSTTTV